MKILVELGELEYIQSQLELGEVQEALNALTKILEENQ